jgi:NADH dehydrogenase/NADH:ubiquinone oxidoreductase subunit G
VEASSEPEFITAATQDDLLDEMSLQTVLDMLAVMVAAEELTQLESLTPAQKRQVWMSTPEDVKVRLRQMKAAAQTESQPTERSEEKGEPEELDELEESEESLDEMGEAIDYADSESINFINLPLFQNSYDLNTPLVEQTFQVGDRVVLKAEPRLTTAELIAVWKIVAIDEEQARIEAKGLGNRQYPISWMVSYPADEPEF